MHEHRGASAYVPTTASAEIRYTAAARRGVGRDAAAKLPEGQALRESLVYDVRVIEEWR